MKTRGMVMTVAILLAVMATGAVFLYVRGVRSQSNARDLVDVIVAKEDIPVGSKLDDVISEGGFTTRKIPADALVRGAITDISDLRGETTNVPILAGEQISAARLVGSEEQPKGGALGIPEGMEALTLSLDVPQAGGGVVQVGDHITVYTTFSDISVLRGTDLDKFLVGKAPVNNDKQELGDYTVTVVPDVEVLKVVQGVVGAQAAGSVQLTLALSPQDVQKVIFAKEKGSMWLALLPPGQPGVNLQPENLLSLLTSVTKQPV